MNAGGDSFSPRNQSKRILATYRFLLIQVDQVESEVMRQDSSSSLQERGFEPLRGAVGVVLNLQRQLEVQFSSLIGSSG